MDGKTTSRLMQEMQLDIAEKMLEIERILADYGGGYFDNHKLTFIARLEGQPEKHYLLSGDSAEFQSVIIGLIGDE